MKGFTTRAIHLKPLKKDPFGSLNFPVYDSVDVELGSGEDIALDFEGKKPSHVYSRITNPTVENFEQKIRSITGASSVAALSSGMAAIANLIIAISQSGDNIITTKHLFGNTYSLFEKTLKPWGLETKYVDLNDINSIISQVDEKTRAIIFETITNPQLEVIDIKAVSRITREKKILLIADSTATPLGFVDLKKLGVNVEALSSSKFISGGATSVGGLIIDHGTYDWANNPKLSGDAKKYGEYTLITKLKREVFRNLGASLSPHNAYLQTLGLETFLLRARKSCANSLLIAKYLEKNPKIKRVDYPGLESSKYYQIASRQFGDLTGAVLTLDLDSKEQCFAFMNKLQTIRRATNFNDNKTLILHPGSTIFCEYSPGLKAEMGVRDKMIRLAVGIEEIEDLIEDINLGLEAI